MNLYFNKKLADQYKSHSQRAKALTEDWVNQQGYCPNCGESKFIKLKNNSPVGDFLCVKCQEEFELKSNKKDFKTKIVDGAYETMIKRLRSQNNPNLFLLNYDLSNFEVSNFLVVPKHFFIPDIIEERKPLAPGTRRQNWIGCNILFHLIPDSGKIFLVRNRLVESKEKVCAVWQKTLFLREEKRIEDKGWLLDIMRCIEQTRKKEFTLADVYKFELYLAHQHPDNRHIKDKIRQQLQILRDRGYLEFIGRGRYRSIYLT